MAAESRPRTVAEAVGLLMCEMSEPERRGMAMMSEAEIGRLGMGLGARIRKRFGLWTGNEQLMADSGALNEDEASLVIIRALWTRLRSREGVPGGHFIRQLDGLLAEWRRRHP